MPQKMTNLCNLGSESSIEDYLLSLNISKTQLKKSGLTKSFLEIKLDKKQEIEIPLNLINQGLIYPTYAGPEVDILFEDNRIICLNKPPKIHCHPLSYTEQNNMLSFLRQNLYLKKTNFCFERKYEGGLLYRLDFETSGVLFFSKDKEQYLSIRKNFKDVAKTKEYICIVHGRFEESGIYKHFLSPYGLKKSRVRVEENGELGQGVIEVSVLEQNIEKNLTLLKVRLFSGIRHQIRAQLSHLGYPILGDTLYGGKESDRLFLHAHKYTMLIGDKNYEVTARKAVLFDRFFNLDRIF
jgi:23S rRNA pseudouridine1911/1915/1917 synthase